MQPFVHLHVHSYYSVLDGQSSIEGLIKTAMADGMPGLALTDHGAMFGIKNFTDAPGKMKGKKLKALEKELAKASEAEKPALEAEKKKWEEWKFKTIIGCECYVAARGRLKKETTQDRSGYHLIVLAKNLKGYKNLIKMVSQSYKDGMYYRPRIDKELLEKYHEGLIVLSACLGGEVPQLIMKGQREQAKQTILWHKELFGEDYYLELQRHKTDKPRGNTETYLHQVEVNKVILELAKETGVKVVATNDVHFVREEDGEAHDRLICVSTNKNFDDPNRMTYTKQEWLKSTAEMNELFSDIPEALSNTIEILDKVEEYSIENPPLMPNFPIPEGFTDADEYLKHLSYEGAKKRFDGELSEEVTTRLDYELDTIKKMGFPGYFLIVQDFIGMARKLGVAVGPGRGSAAGSLVSYCLGITDLDPLKYDLLFERFLNPDRISLPDIDIDFDDDGRQDILRWVTEHYGADNVAHIVTYGTMASKSAIKDVGRVLGLPLNETNMLTKLIPDKLPEGGKVNIKNALEQIPELRDIYYGNDPLKHDVLEYAKQLEGTVRNTGVHACGIIIGRSAIDDVVPTWVTRDSDSGEDILVTQYEGSVIESTGLIKMDFLGLKTLSIIRATLNNIKKRHGIDLDINSVPLDDPKTYQLFCEGKTSAVFQFESPGMQKSLIQLQPSKFEDLIAMVALYRPGPMDNIPSFIARKHGKEPIHYDLDVMEEYLKETYGITVYQEQVMLLSRKIANFTRGESDSLRKAMGKKLIEQMNALKDKFMAGGQSNGHPEEMLEKIWNDWVKFASYAFNKSHAACYAWVAYQTAYLKANYTAEFMAGVMSRNVNNITEITKYIDESKKMGIQVYNPDVNESEYYFSVNDQGDIRFGLGAIKGFSKTAANGIVEEREKNGPFMDIYDFFERTDSRIATKKVCEALVLSGGFDSFDSFKREDFFATSEHKDETFLDRLIRFAQRSQAEKAQAQNSLFGVEEFQAMAKPTLDVKGEPWSDIERLNKEKELLGFYLTASPLDPYGIALKYKCNMRCSDLSGNMMEFAGKEVTFGGIVTGYREMTTRKGHPAGFIKIQDYNGEGELALFGEQFPKFSHYGKEGLFLYVTADAEMGYSRDRVYLKIRSISLLNEMHETLTKELRITLPEWSVTEEFYNEIVPDLLELPPGKVDIIFTIYDPKSRVHLNMDSARLQNVSIPIRLLEKLSIFEENGVKFEIQ
ncbi:DNA polymerase III subunit alpha [Porphyromonadaceae bacterium W3.11]|nr:DNA polymerase III subunit alpha [Porphyromonadaceae bacterium W3.11]